MTPEKKTPENSEGSTQPTNTTEVPPNFEVYCPRIYVYIAWAVAGAFAIGGLSLIIFPADPDQYNQEALIVLAVVCLIIAAFFVYLALYHGSFHTRVQGNTIWHKELFHEEFEFEFTDITEVRLGAFSGPGMARLRVYVEGELYMIPEEAYVGFAYFKQRMKDAGMLWDE